MKLLGISPADLNRLNLIHITGTKGKGSTCHFIESILRKHGMKTGLFTSPHLIKPNERIKINGESISDTEFARIFFKCNDRFLVHLDLL